MVTGAAVFMFRCVLDGSLQMRDTDMERRPYHRNCKCALHKPKADCPHSAASQRRRNVSFPTKQLTNKRSFSVSASATSSRSYYVGNSLPMVRVDHAVESDVER
ncbi:UNVERIFIED_CONTAM: hypothetical protein Sradi_4381200 [Sesamum radiatum]|uniref:SWIM-type domain-containing protein n=1 Tax=Sesamum radiatum TaxID=300843 RepID=A0AAW2NP13_SESRA